MPSSSPVAVPTRPPAHRAFALVTAGYVDGDAPFANDVWRFDMGAAAEEGAEGAKGAEEGGEGAKVGSSRGVWRRLNPSGAAPSPAFGHTAAADGAGHVFLFGGFGGQFSNELHVFSHNASDGGDGGAWARVAHKGEMPSPRHKHSMVLSPQVPAAAHQYIVTSM